MKQIHRKTFILLLCALLVLGGCQSQTSSEQTTVESSESSQIQAETSQSSSTTITSTIDVSSQFSDRDLDGTYDESSAIKVQLNGSSASCDSDAVTISGSQIIVKEEGVYLFSGSLTDGQIVVSAGDTDKVQIVLNGAEITSSTSATV